MVAYVLGSFGGVGLGPYNGDSDGCGIPKAALVVRK